MEVKNKFTDLTVNKFLVLLALICINICLIIIAISGTSNGYEISIFNMYPIYFWILIVLITLIITIPIGIYSSYASVLSGSTNSQVTYSELTGTQWFFDHNNQNLKIYSVDNEISRFFDADKGMENNTFYEKYTLFYEVGLHFNFTNSEGGYLVLTDYTIERYTNYWPNNPDFSKEDIENLNNNTQIDKIYSDNGIDVLIKN